MRADVAVSCLACGYFDRAMLKGVFQNHGRCRRNAPSYTCIGTEEWDWPVVNVEEWCGEFKRASDA